MGGISSTQTARLLKPTFVNCSHVCSRFSPTWSIFAVECDWNSKISQNVQDLRFFFEKIDVFFSEKKLEFLQNR